MPAQHLVSRIQNVMLSANLSDLRSSYSGLAFIIHSATLSPPVTSFRICSCTTSSVSVHKESKRKPRGYWKDIGNIQKELIEFRSKSGDSEQNLMPSAKQLRSGGRRDLDNAITNFGGYRKVAQTLGWSPNSRRRSRGFWDDFSNLQEELMAFIRNSSLELTPGTMPTLKQLRLSGRSDLEAAIGRHNGVAAVAERLQLRRVVEKKPKNYWSDWNTVQEEVLNFVEKQSGTEKHLLGSKSPRMKREKMPSLQKLRASGKGDLAEGISNYHGGFRAVAHKLELVSKKNDFYYKYFYNLAKEVYCFCREAGIDGTMPSSAILREKGRTDLAAAIVKCGGMVKVSRRLGLLYQIRAKETLKHWHQFRGSLLGFMSLHGNSEEIPSSRVLEQFGRADLYQAILHHGGSKAVSDRMHLKRNYLQDFFCVGYELLNFIDLHGTEGVMPTEAEFLQVGRNSLNVAVEKFGRAHVANRLGLRQQSKGTNLVRDDSEVTEEDDIMGVD